MRGHGRGGEERGEEHREREEKREGEKGCIRVQTHEAQEDGCLHHSGKVEHEFQ